MLVAGTGHRPKSLPCGYQEERPWAVKVKGIIRSWLDQHRPESVFSGMAEGYDTWLAEAALALGIPLVAMLPCHRQSSKWSMSARVRHGKILKRATAVRYSTQELYTPGCMQKRNADLVAALTPPGDVLLALWNGTPAGGTFDTIERARASGITVVNLWPSS